MRAITRQHLAVGAALPPLTKGKLTSSHIVRWCAAQQNWAKIHYDDAYARNVAKLPGTLINGALKQHFLVQFLTEAFDGQAWIWRIDYQFTGLDLVGQSLEVRGMITQVENFHDRRFISIDLDIVNVDLNKSTTKATAVVFLDDADFQRDALDLVMPPALSLNTEIEAPAGELAEDIAAAIGSTLELKVSDCPVDLSRLRLFADAIMGMRRIHFDPEAAASGPYASVVAPPLFPLHGLEFSPDTLTLSDEPLASGREGVAELPRGLAARFGIAPSGSLNGGSEVEIHSLVRLGERVVGESVLAGAKQRISSSGKALLLFTTVNRYRESGGRPLLTERHTSIYRL